MLLVPVWILLELNLEVSELLLRQPVSALQALQPRVWVYKLLVNNEFNFLLNLRKLFDFLVFIINITLYVLINLFVVGDIRKTAFAVVSFLLQLLNDIEIIIKNWGRSWRWLRMGALLLICFEAQQLYVRGGFLRFLRFRMQARNQVLILGQVYVADRIVVLRVLGRIALLILSVGLSSSIVAWALLSLDLLVLFDFPVKLLILILFLFLLKI